MVSVGRANFLSNDLTTTRFTNRDTPTHRHTHVRPSSLMPLSAVVDVVVATPLPLLQPRIGVRCVRLVVPAVVDSRCHCTIVCLFRLVCGVYWPRMLIIVCTMAGIINYIYELDSL